ncbi:MAG: hypothetical protein RIB78_03255 [Gammaproteobacteria bacterium]
MIASQQAEGDIYDSDSLILGIFIVYEIPLFWLQTNPDSWPRLVTLPNRMLAKSLTRCDHIKAGYLFMDSLTPLLPNVIKIA